MGIFEDYYKKIAALENEIGYDILLALNDFTLSKDIYDGAKNEAVTTLSLLRDIREPRHEEHIQAFYSLLSPPINLGTMRRIYGSTGWDDVDKALIEMQKMLSQANINLHYNAIATIGRKIIALIANEIYDDELHRDKETHPDELTKGMYIKKLQSFVDYQYAENSLTKNLKNYLKSTIALVNGYVHKENTEHFESFLCVHAVISLAFQLSIISQKERYNEAIHRG